MNLFVTNPFSMRMSYCLKKNHGENSIFCFFPIINSDFTDMKNYFSYL